MGAFFTVTSIIGFIAPAIKKVEIERDAHAAAFWPQARAHWPELPCTWPRRRQIPGGVMQVSAPGETIWDWRFRPSQPVDPPSVFREMARRVTGNARFVF